MIAIGAFFRTWWKAGLGIIIGALLIFPLAQCKGEKIGQQRAALALERANRQFLEQKARADALAADRRLTDTIAVSNMEKGLRDAIATTPDTAPDAVRIRLGCERLRRAPGTNPASLPAICRSSGGSQARPPG
jgi:hypothetical protein